VKNASTKTDILSNLEAIYDIVLDRQIKTSESILNKYLKMKIRGKNQSGVQTAQVVDDDTRVILETAKKWMSVSVHDVTDEAREIADKLQDETDEFEIRQLNNQLVGLNIAARYASTAVSARKDIEKIEKQIETEQAKIKNNQEEKTDKNGRKYQATKEGKLDEIKASREAIAAFETQLRTIKGELIKGLDSMILDFSGLINLGRLAKNSFDNRIKERKHQVHKETVLDLADVKPPIIAKKVQKSNTQKILEAIGSPLHSFAYELRKYGRYAIDGEGYMFNHYVPAIINASQMEYEGRKAAKSMMDGKTKELFNMSWTDTMRKVSGQDLGLVITITKGKGEHTETNNIELTNGTGLYIYMVNKMGDGKVKLRAMGISEADVAQIAEKLPPKLVQLGDWIQNEFLPTLRVKYNKRHLEIFGAQMANIEFYIPLLIAQDSIHEEVDINAFEIQLPATITGSLISRTRNVKAVDIVNVDAMNLIVEHVDDMEHWYAYAEVTQDINTLLSSKTFKNKIEKLGKGNYETFKEAAQVALGVYKPKKSKADEVLTTVAGSFAASKVAFKLNTAMKQALSLSSFVAEAGDPYFLARLAKNSANIAGSWNWAMKNLDLFVKRWEGGLGGDDKLDVDSLLNPGQNRVAKWLKEIASQTATVGMIPNAFVDAVVSSVGSRSVYESKKAKYLKMGFSEDTAEEKAIKDATLAYNETQQSAEGLFLSAIQRDRTSFALTVSVFNNQSFGAARKMVIAGRNVGRIAMKRKQMIEFRKQQLIAEGLDEAGAEKYAVQSVHHSLYKSLAQVVMHGFVNQYVWKLAGMWTLFAFGGDDGEEELKQKHEIAFWTTLLGPFRGFVGGESLEGVLEKILKGDTMWGTIAGVHPVTQDVEKTVRGVVNSLKKDDFVGATWQFLSFASTVYPVTAGIDINTASNVIAGLSDLVYTNEDLTWQQVALDFSFIINAPPTQTRQLAESLKTGKVDAFIKEYGAFKDKYGLSYPLINEPVYGEIYREKFSRLKNAFNKFVTEKRKKAKESKIPESAALSKYNDMANHFKVVYDGKLSGSVVLKNNSAMKPLEDSIKALQKALPDVTDKKTRDEMKKRIIKLREQQTELAKKEIPYLEKKLKELGIPY
jgi:hypothetical protein